MTHPVASAATRVAELESALAAKEKELGQVAAQFSLFFNHFLDAVLVVEVSSGLIFDANDSVVRFLRYPRDELVSSDFRLLFPPAADDDRENLMSHLQVHGHVFFEQPFLRSDGEVVVADLSATVVMWQGHEAILLILRDAAERMAFEERVREAEEMRGRLETVARLNHEINNPLQELLSCVALDGEERYREPVMRIAEVLRELRKQEPRFSSAILTADSPAVCVDEPLEPGVPNAAMIVDDEDAIRLVLAKLLQHRLPTLSIDTAADGLEAVRQFEATHHEVIVMDVNMPKMNGDEAFLRIMDICKERKWVPPSVVFCTGYNASASVRAAVERTPKHLCLLKPVDTKYIIAAVQERVTG